MAARRAVRRRPRSCAGTEVNDSVDRWRAHNVAVSKSSWWVFPFGPGVDAAESAALPAALLGESGAALVRLARARFPVPPGFVVSAEVCAHYGRTGGRFPAGVWDQIRDQLRRLEAAPLHEMDTGRRPLLIRFQTAGAPAPWRDDQPVTLGFNDATAEQWQAVTGDPAAPWREFARSIRTYAVRVLRLPDTEWEPLRLSVLARHGAADEAALPAEGCRELCAAYRKIFQERARRAFPADLLEQIRGMLIGLYETGGDARDGALDRPGLSIGVSAILSAAVFGDVGNGSAVCMAWSRDPVSGAYGARGELRDPCGPTDDRTAVSAGVPLSALAAARGPHVRLAFGPMGRLLDRAEELAGSPQCLEFVIERGRLWVVRVADLRRTPEAAVRWVVEMAVGRDLASGRAQPRRLTPDGALMKVAPQDLLGSRWNGRRGAAARARAHLLEWSDARHPFEVLVRADRPEQAGPARADGVAGVAWWPTGRSPTPRSAAHSIDPAWSDLCEAFLSDWRGRRVLIAIPAALGFAASTAPPSGTGEREASVAAWAQALVPPLRRLRRGRGTLRIDIAMAAGDLSDRFLRAIAAGRRGVSSVEAALHRRVSCSFGVLVDVPRAAVAIDTIAEWLDFAIFDVTRLDAALRGAATDEARGLFNGGRFDAEGLGVALETGMRRLRSVRPTARFGMAIHRLPDAAFFRFCLRTGVDRIVCPPDAASAMRLAAAQAAMGRGGSAAGRSGSPSVSGPSRPAAGRLPSRPPPRAGAPGGASDVATAT